MKAAFALKPLAWLLGALAVICVLFAWMAASADCPGKPDDWPRECSLLKFFFDWQQLLGSLVAIVAAGIGWVAVHRQITQTEEHEQRRAKSNLAASRSTLPLALSGMSEYCAACIDALLPLYAKYQSEVLDEETEAVVAKEWQPPELPRPAIDDLKSMVQASSPPVGQPIAALLRVLQKQGARLNTMRRDFVRSGSSVMKSNVEEYVVNTIEIQARTNALFAFGRGESDYPSGGEPTRGQMHNASMSLAVHDGLYPRIDERMNRDYSSA